MDLRYLKRPKAMIGVSESSEVRGDIVSFLEYIYSSVAETLPDYKDELLEGNSVDVGCIEDPYAAEFGRRADAEAPAPAPVRVRKSKPRKLKRQVQLNLDRTSEQFEERFLPPGSMKEYFDQYVLQSNLAKPASFPSFWRAAWLS